MTQVNLIKALIQCDFPAIVKNKTNPHFKSKYADLDAIRDAITPVLAKNGLCITQVTALDDNNRTRLCTTLWHESGEAIESWYLLPDVADPQKMGSALTYIRRYSICALLNLTAEDDDAQQAKADSQKAELITQIKEMAAALEMTPEQRVELMKKEFKGKPVDKLSIDELETLLAYLSNELEHATNA